MLPKNVLGREYYRRLYIYSDDKINYQKTKNNESSNSTMELEKNWIKVEL
jgi:ribosomal protein L13